MGYIDMHCDTLMMAEFFDLDMGKNDKCCIDFEKMKKGNAMAQFFAIYMPNQHTYEACGVKPYTDEEYFQKAYMRYLKNMEAYQNVIRPAYTAKDILENEKNGLMSGVLTVEDGRLVNNNFETLEDWYDMGVRAIALTWNYENCFGFPNSKDEAIMKKGLKDFGKDAIPYMNDLGIMIDVSHLSDGGFYDVAKLSEKPFIATHSNCRALSSHPRNLTDEMIKILSEKGGVMGLNFCPNFLNEDITDDDAIASLDAMIAHVKHAVNVGGIDVIALGSDYDGFYGNIEIPTCDKYPLLFERFKKEGFSAEDIDKITHKNILRVMKECCF